MSDMHQNDDSPRDAGADRQADDRLIHALLLHLGDNQAAEHREQRVQRAMGNIREPVQPQPADAFFPAMAHSTRTPRLPVWARRGTWATAAAVLVILGVWVFTYSPTPAMASLSDILASLGRPGDRTYRIHMQDQPAPPERRRPDKPASEMAPRPGLDNATLYLRDGRQFLLVRDDPNGGTIFDGFDGRQSWRITGGILAEMREGLGAGGIPMPPIMANVPFSDLHQTLERIRVDYTVEQLDQSPLSDGGEALRHVRVRRNSREVKGPETIEIWADSKTAIPKRIVFDRAKVQGNREPCRITVDLITEEPLSPNWFSPAPHTAE